MTVERGWWHDAGGDEDRARWLGLIPRPVRLALRAPVRLLHEASAPSQAVHVAIGETALATPGRCPASVAHFPEAGRVVTALRHPSGAPHGRYDLASIRLDDEPAAPWWDGPASGGDPLVEERPIREREVPLWRRLAIALQLPTYLLLDQAGPIEWPDPLFPYQLEGVRAFLERDALLLADDMGLGKTIQALAALRILVHQRRAERALIVTPAGLLAQWREALARWSPELRVSTVRGPAVERVWQWRTPAHVYLVSYDTLRADTTANPASPPRRQTWDVVILDEAQRAKNPDSNTHRACRHLPRRRTWALTGTPLENSLEELAAVLALVRGARTTRRRRACSPGRPSAPASVRSSCGAAERTSCRSCRPRP